MTQGSPTTPVTVSVDAPTGAPALRVVGVAVTANTTGGPALPVAMITDAQVAAGYPVQGNVPVPMGMVSDGRPTLGQRPVPVYVVSGALAAYAQLVPLLGPLRYWPFDDLGGSAAREVVAGNTASYRNSVAPGTAWPTASGLPAFVAPGLFPATGDILLNSASWASLFSFNEGSCAFWIRATTAAWDDATLRRPLILQADSSNRILLAKNAGVDTLAATYTGAGTSKTITIGNVTQFGSGWLHIVLTWSKTADAFKLYINGVVQGTATALPTVSGTLSTIAQFAGNPNFPNSTYAHGALWTRALTQAEIDFLYYNVVRDRLVVFEGDSLTVGGQNGATPYPKQLLRGLTNETVAQIVATSGEKVSDMVAQYASTVAPLYRPSTYRKNTAVLFGGANDVTNETAADAYSRLQQWWALARATGFKVVACTLPAGAPAAAGGGYNTRRNSLNTLIKSDTSLYDALADLAANGNIGDDGDQDNTTYFNADKLHLTTTGYGVVATIVAAAIANV